MHGFACCVESLLAGAKSPTEKQSSGDLELLSTPRRRFKMGVEEYRELAVVRGFLQKGSY